MHLERIPARLKTTVLAALQWVSENDLYSLKQSVVGSIYTGTVTLFGIFLSAEYGNQVFLNFEHLAWVHEEEECPGCFLPHAVCAWLKNDAGGPSFLSPGVLWHTLSHACSPDAQLKCMNKMCHNPFITCTRGTPVLSSGTLVWCRSVQSSCHRLGRRRCKIVSLFLPTVLS